MQVDQPKTGLRIWTNRLARALAAAAVGLGAAGTPALAQSEGAPPGATPVEIEMWHGLRRVDARARPAPRPERVVPAEPSPALPAAGTPTLADALRPLAGLSGDKAAPVTVILGGYNIHQTKEGQPSSEGEEAPARPAPVQPAGGGRAPELLPASIRNAAEPPPAPIIVLPAPAAAPTAAGQDAGHGLFGSTLVQISSVFLASLLGPLVFVVFLHLFFRRHRKRGGALFRIEFLGGQAPPTGYWVPGAPPAATPAPAAPATPPADVADAPPVEGTGEHFELGPTYEEELHQRQDQVRQQEEAVLRQLFEDNVRLREQMAQESMVISH